MPESCSRSWAEDPCRGPHVSSAILAVFTVLAGGTEEQKREWLPLLAKGERSLVLAVTEDDYSWEQDDIRLVAKRNGNGFRLNGTKVYVFDATSATHLLCAARSEDNGNVGLVAVPSTAPGVEIRSLPGFAWNLGEVKLNDVAAEESDLLGLSFEAGWNALQRAIGRTIPVLGAYQVGGCQAVYDMSVEYSRTRIQFGTPIGRFQRGAGPYHQPGQPAGRGPVDHIRGSMEAGHG